jgi:hypothetical protein
MSKVFYADLFDAKDGTGDQILQFPDELLTETGWKEGTVLDMRVESTPTGNVIIVTEKKDD